MRRTACLTLFSYNCGGQGSFIQTSCCQRASGQYPSLRMDQFFRRAVADERHRLPLFCYLQPLRARTNVPHYLRSLFCRLFSTCAHTAHFLCARVLVSGGAAGSYIFGGVAGKRKGLHTRLFSPALALRALLAPPRYIPLPFHPATVSISCTLLPPQACRQEGRTLVAGVKAYARNRYSWSLTIMLYISLPGACHHGSSSSSAG